MRAAGRRRLLRLVEPKAPRLAGRLIDDLSTALTAQTVTVPAEETIGRVIRDLTIELGRLAAARERLAAEIEAVFSDQSTLRRRSCSASRELRHGPAPGRILTEIGDITRFPTPGHLAAYAGLAPVTRQSGAQSTASTSPAAATTASRTRSGSPRSAACTTHQPATTTPASVRRERSTTPPSCASPAAAATSSTGCSPPA
jgi:transposase